MQAKIGNSKNKETLNIMPVNIATTLPSTHNYNLVGIVQLGISPRTDHKHGQS